MTMIPQQPTRFGSLPAMTPLGMLRQNAGRIAADFAYGKIHDLSSVRNNAFILSSLIQVVSRIFVANKSAQETRNKPEGILRYKEAVKTTFREAMGFCLSYIVLRSFQRATVDLFRNYLWIQKGLLSSKPTMFNGIFQRWFKTPKSLMEVPEKIFPTLRDSVLRLKEQVSLYRRGKLKPLELLPVDRLFRQELNNRGVFIHASRQGKYRRMEPLVNWVNKIAGKPLDAPQEMKLQTFLDWLPPLVGSIPALFLSGFMLERFSQKYAEPIAEKIANRLGQNPNSPLRKPLSKINAPLAFKTLDQTRNLPYASGQGTPLAAPGVMFNGYPTVSGARFASTAWPTAVAGGYGNGFGPFIPH